VRGGPDFNLHAGQPDAQAAPCRGRPSHPAASDRRDAGTRDASSGAITNRDIAELLAVAADVAEGHTRRALRRASRAALLWPIEAVTLVASGRSPTELDRVGPYLARRIREWIDAGTAPPPAPALRQDFLTLTEAQAILSEDPTWASSLRGDLQIHTTWSDGTTSIAVMAEAARARGLEYLAITDHTQSLRIARGLDPDRLNAQACEIDAVNAAMSGTIRILRAAEMNLDPAGGGDMPSATLAGLDLVLGAFHSALRRTEDQTERYLAALRNPDVHVLAHPRGRIYNFRHGLPADWSRVCAVAATLDKAVEIDAYPDRQDLNVDLLAHARAAGTRVSIGSDAHHPRELDVIVLGLAAARRAGIAPDRVVNFLSADELVAWTAALRRAN
jgi:histidinol phosphatase-like PHP family hydrolase